MIKIKKLTLSIIVILFIFTSCGLKNNSLYKNVNTNCNISKEEALEIAKNKLGTDEGKKIIEIDDIKKIGNKLYYPVHAYYEQNYMSVTEGWYYIEVDTKKIYEAYVGITELLIPIDNVTFINEDCNQKLISREKALSLFSKAIKIDESKVKALYYDIVGREGKEYYLVIIYDKSKDLSNNITPEAYQFYCVEKSTGKVYKWNIDCDELSLISEK